MRARTPALVVAAALLAAGCGGSGDEPERPPEQARVGIVGEQLTASEQRLAEQMGRDLPDQGVLVMRFEGDPPASRAGISDMGANQNSMTDSDAIETVDGKPATEELLWDPMPGKRPGDVVTLRVWTPQGERRDVEVKLDADPTADEGNGFFPGG